MYLFFIMKAAFFDHFEEKRELQKSASCFFGNSDKVSSLSFPYFPVDWSPWIYFSGSHQNIFEKGTMFPERILWSWCGVWNHDAFIANERWNWTINEWTVCDCEIEMYCRVFSAFILVHIESTRAQLIRHIYTYIHTHEQWQDRLYKFSERWQGITYKNAYSIHKLCVYERLCCQVDIGMRVCDLRHWEKWIIKLKLYTHNIQIWQHNVYIIIHYSIYYILFTQKNGY